MFVTAYLLSNYIYKITKKNGLTTGILKYFSF